MRNEFEIFSGSRDDEPLWLEFADGLSEAIARMKQRFQENPGRYFVYDIDSQAVVASIDADEASQT